MRCPSSELIVVMDELIGYRNELKSSKSKSKAPNCDSQSSLSSLQNRFTKCADRIICTRDIPRKPFKIMGFRTFKGIGTTTSDWNLDAQARSSIRKPVAPPAFDIHCMHMYVLAGITAQHTGAEKGLLQRAYILD